MRILHLADLHVSASRTFGGIRVLHPSGRNAALVDLIDAVRALIAEAGKGGPIAGCVVAGDVFDTARPSPEEIGTAAEILYLLAAACEAGKVLVISGNHDAVKGEEKPSALVAVQFAPFVVARERFDVVSYAGAQWVCLPYPRTGAIRQALQGSDAGAAETLSDVVAALVYSGVALAAEACDRGAPPLAGLVAHCDYEGATVGLQPRALTGDVRLPVGAARHVPAVLLGHIHKQQPIPGAPNAAFPGSPVVCDFGEESYGHGACLWTFADAAPGAKHYLTATLDFLQAQGRSWETVAVDAESFDRVRGMFADLAPGATVWRCKGTLPGEQFHALRDVLKAARARGVIVQDALELQRADRARLRVIEGLAAHPTDADLTAAALAERGILSGPGADWLRALHAHVESADPIAVKKEGGRGLALAALSERPCGLGAIEEPAGEPAPVPVPTPAVPATPAGQTELF